MRDLEQQFVDLGTRVVIFFPRDVVHGALMVWVVDFQYILKGSKVLSNRYLVHQTSVFRSEEK
jgi:hypothetical protein